MKLSLHEYRLPLRHPFRIGRKSHTRRGGYLIRAEHEGVSATGEAAPLPGFSRETLSESRKQAVALAEPICNLLKSAADPEELHDFHIRNRVCPSLQFAIDTLWTDLESQKRGVGPGSLLFTVPLNTLAINAVLQADDPQTVLPEAEKRYREGFRTFKFKMGTDPEPLIPVLEAIRSRWPEIALRIDANRSWQLPEARNHLQRLAPLRIEYCEEPLARPTPGDYRTLQSDGGIPLALDETLAELPFNDDLLPFVDLFILKPMVMGSFTKNLATKTLADNHGIETVVTSSMEGVVGRTMSAIIAGGIGSARKAHGLSTGSVLIKDLSADTVYTGSGQMEPAAVTRLPKVEYGILKENIIDSIVL